MRHFNMISLEDAIALELVELTEAEKKVIYCFLLQCKNNKTKIKVESIEIHSNDYAKILGMTGIAAQKFIRNALDVLFERYFTYAVFNKNAPIEYVVTRWIGSYSYDNTDIDLPVRVDFTVSVLKFLNDALLKINSINPDLIFLPEELKEVQH